MTTRPTVTLHAPSPASTGVQRRLRALLHARCGPCVVVVVRAEDQWARHTTYDLSGPWPISAAEVHRHLVAAFSLLVGP
ncbi:hypothetical protein E5F05_06905 [Deinococcus metallilatus]|uniref:Uncharacterized protein n=1 Tax=Deinococcus metallilatus TaxID=1211322 RepID=A0AAJ5F6Q4_9DEIO|nr:hypothetical protein [Deinococcus metallilatus]MBB5294675.1 hypothetical protein [Deinococcus metallilatus]QBY07710.1 hypothetical protein E5F05_06905 [Deinococcus metallilatus]RXJ14126.1 hypothetical protein ERJ73_05740 [Deinococcus metallilatus]TLK30091.1 hypothetical protein FCS05_06055 [Deinococcus metallilatus]GMA15892.1 hypothetical protein GCM10025871_22230 [Deinococcus metallilatus]